MINYLAVNISGLDMNAQGEVEVQQNLKMLYTTPAGTIPFDRDFGINTDFLDEPLNVAKGRIIVEYTEKTKRYEPRAKVEEVIFDAVVNTGMIIPKVVISIDLETE